MNFRTVFVCLGLLVIGGIYHANGQNDWFAATAVSEGLTPAQMANEIIACMNFVAAGVVYALAPRPTPSVNKE